MTYDYERMAASEVRAGETPSGEVKDIKSVVAVFPNGKYSDDAILWPSLEDLNPDD